MGFANYKVYPDVDNLMAEIKPELLQKYPQLERIIGKALYPYDDSQNPERSRIAPFMRTGTDPFA